MQECSN